jgi:hypothetical protein
MDVLTNEECMMHNCHYGQSGAGGAWQKANEGKPLPESRPAIAVHGPATEAVEERPLLGLTAGNFLG